MIEAWSESVNNEASLKSPYVNRVRRLTGGGLNNRAEVLFETPYLC
ncbi:MAG: hypothetical protein ABSB19_15730 [Methylomonas sp.]|jgi:hypothetical protein